MMESVMDNQPKHRVEIFWSEKDGGYIANIPELKYCSAFGDTREEALHEVLVAEELHLETLEEMGREAPDAVTEPAHKEKSSITDNLISTFGTIIARGDAVSGHAPDTDVYIARGALSSWDSAHWRVAVSTYEGESSRYIESETLDEEFFHKLLSQK